MNGMAASEKIFRLLDLPELADKSEMLNGSYHIECENVSFSYEKDREILHGIQMTFEEKQFTAIVGESGSGKSTISSILMGRNQSYSGSVTIGGKELKALNEADLMAHITYIGHQSHLFKGTVRDNLLMGCPDASDEKLWKMLDRVRLSAFLHSENGLDTMVSEKGANLSGGQCQRLALARALLHDSPVYIFDEATSNIDVESENDIMRQIYALANEKTVILISHRLANVTGADTIYVMDNGRVAECGTHETLCRQGGIYERLWNTQAALEHYGEEGVQR